MVASALGPFYLFEGRLIAAALEAGAHYVSICDDWSATLDAFMRFDGPAREKGLTVVTGSGASPGMTNVAARLLADRMDRAEQVDIYVYVPMQSREGEATIMHALFVYGTTVPVFRGCTSHLLPAGCESRKVEMPGVGCARVWNVGHSEPVTMPRYLPHLREMNMMMGLGTGTGALVAAGRAGVFKTPRRRALLSKYYVRLTGVKGGKPLTLTACGTASMRDSTGLGLSVGTLLTGTGRLTAGGGVFAPEGCFDPTLYMGMMAERGIHVYSDLAMTERR